MLKLLDKIPPESFVLSGHQIETKKLFELFEVFLVPISPNLFYIYIYIYIYIYMDGRVILESLASHFNAPSKII
jgi:hypothetical protein